MNAERVFNDGSLEDGENGGDEMEIPTLLLPKGRAGPVGWRLKTLSEKIVTCHCRTPLSPIIFEKAVIIEADFLHESFKKYNILKNINGLDHFREFMCLCA